MLEGSSMSQPIKQKTPETVNKIYQDAISFIEGTKKEVFPREAAIKENYTFGDPKLNHAMKAWFAQKETGDLLRFFDEEGNVEEVKLDFEKLYDKKELILKA